MYQATIFTFKVPQFSVLVLAKTRHLGALKQCDKKVLLRYFYIFELFLFIPHSSAKDYFVTLTRLF